MNHLKRWAIALMLLSDVVLGNPGLEETNAQTLSDDLSPETIGGLPSGLLPKISQLAGILQQKINDGTLSEARIQQELSHGDMVTVIKGLGPEASRLLEEISASLRNSYSEESLLLMLTLLMNSASVHQR
ncbi:MAG TPA: hypothetical protein VJ692_13675 [Nitrospiraceae bacterium]|nr:hypothetical protein [Nitrospiraceae bacterium]